MKKGVDGCTCKPGAGRHSGACPSRSVSIALRSAERVEEGARLRRARHARGLALHELAPLVGVASRQGVSQMELGDYQLSPKARAWLAAEEGMVR